MFTIMENRKRPRLEIINKSNNNSNENMQGVALTTTAMDTATYTTIEGQSFILSNSSTSPLPANILLSICDDNSNDSDEYILDHSSLLSPIKQEHTVATQTNNNQSQLPQNTLISTMPQYRIINQAGKSLNTTNLNSTSSSMADNTIVNTNNSLMSNSLHLASGCEIYVIKEVFDLPKRIIAESHNTSSNAGLKALVANGTTIKPVNVLPEQRNSTLKVNTNTQSRSSNPTITINNIAPVTTNTTTSKTSLNSSDDTAKRSLILEAYKKRDDKRRAIHNEVERRRRDKINSWIFKLKEMLPADVTNYNQQGSATTTRTQPNDSKSQILIKACEYIKSMQEEIDSLRECLTENENLRLKNQRLQAEINNLRNKQQQQQKLHNNNNNNNNNSNHNSDNSDNCEITLNSLNTTYANVQLFAPSTNHQNHNHDHLVDFVGLTANSNITTTPTSANIIYNKRELIITDYVD